MDPDLEPLLAKSFHKLVGDDVPVLRDEVPRGSVAGLDLYPQELRQLLVADLRFDIVSKHQRPRPVARP
jgi:hypothetical protein